MGADRNYDDVTAFTRTGSAGEVIFQEGDKGTDLFLVQEGRIELVCGPAQALAATVEAGDIFGEWSFFERQPRDLTARALTDFRILKLDRPALDRIISEAPEIAAWMLHKLARRLHARLPSGIEPAVMATPAAPQPVIAGPAAPTIAPARIGPGSAAPTTMPPGRAAAGAASAPIKPGPAAPTIAPRRIAAGSDPPTAPTGRTGAGAAAITGPRLVATRSGKSFPLGAAEMVVGRADRATGKVPDVDLTDLDIERTLSRRHAKIVKRDAAFFVCEDVSSRNGTFVNGQRLTAGKEVELHDGDEVLFGVVKTHFKQ